MSAQTPNKATTLPSPARQQLDELESFIQQMLNVPVSHVAGDDMPTTATQTRPRDEERAFDRPPDEHETLPTTPPVVVETSEPTETEAGWDERPANKTTPRLRPRLDERTRYRKSVLKPLWLWPIIGINKAFDAPTYSLGRTGSWVRESGRTVAAWIGVGLIVAAVAWVAIDWLTWKW